MATPDLKHSDRLGPRDTRVPQRSTERATTANRRSGPKKSAAVKGKSGKRAARPADATPEFHLEYGSAGTSFGDVYRMDVLDRIKTIQHGVQARSVGQLAKSMHRSKDRVAEMLGLSVTTVDRKAKQGDVLSPEQSERVLATAKLIGQVQAMVEESGDLQGFNAAQWLAKWLDTPLNALGGRPPADLMNTAEGRDLLSRLLATAQSGAYV